MQGYFPYVANTLSTLARYTTPTVTHSFASGYKVTQRRVFSETELKQVMASFAKDFEFFENVMQTYNRYSTLFSSAKALVELNQIEIQKAKKTAHSIHLSLF